MHNSALKELLDSYRLAAATEREKGKYFEGLILCYLRNEAAYRDLYSDVWTYGEWATSNKGWIAVIPASIWWQKNQYRRMPYSVQALRRTSCRGAYKNSDMMNFRFNV